MTIRRPIATVILAGVVAGWGMLASAWGQSPWHEGFEAARTSWHDDGGDVQYRVLRHQRTASGAYRGQGCEHIRVEGRHGTHIHFVHPIGRPRVIEELRPSVWVRSDRAGLQLAVRVALPRTSDPRTGEPVETLIAGQSYTDVGRWQRLFVDRLPERLARQVRALRTELGPGVDGREAYVEALVLNVYGGPGVTNVWVDELDVEGHVGPTFRRSTVDDGQAGRDVGGTPATEVAASPGLTRLPSAEPATGPELTPAQGSTAPPTSIALNSGVLNVDRRPMFPRMIEHRGEPLGLLKRLGFNAVWLDQPPSGELLAEAARQGLWLICPPPTSLTGNHHESAVAARFEIGPEYDRVLAWQLGRELAHRDGPRIESLAERLRAADQRHRRPIVLGARSGLRGFSRQVDLLLLDRRPLGTSLELRDYGRWVQRQPRLARPGTPVWTTVQTQPAPAQYEQLAALQPGCRPPTAFSPEQIRLLALTALAAGSRGLLFVSESPLDAEDPDTLQRAKTLELLNLQLDLIEPWAAAGSFVAAVDSTEPAVTGAVLRTHRARLVLPLWLGAGAQYVADQSAAHRVSLVVPGAPESAIAYELGPDRFSPIEHHRVTGGVRVTLDEFGVSSMVVLAQDPLLVAKLTKKARQIGPRAAALHRDLAARRLNVVSDVERELGPAPRASLPSAAWLEQAREEIRYCETLLKAGQYAQAILHARRANRPLRLLERARWRHMAGAPGQAMISPGTTGFRALPWQARLADRISVSRPGPNRLYQGNFEDLGRMIQSGWRHFEHQPPVAGTMGAAAPTSLDASGDSTIARRGTRRPPVYSSADLVVEAAHGGRTGLRLTARPDDPDAPPPVIETAPLWITTPPISVDAGELLVLQAWVNVPEPITGSVDGLMIFDTFSGEALAERVGQTEGWRRITLYRIAPRSGPMRVTFALTGLGEARLDDVSLHALHYTGNTPVARRRR